MDSTESSRAPTLFVGACEAEAFTRAKASKRLCELSLTPIMAALTLQPFERKGALRHDTLPSWKTVDGAGLRRNDLDMQASGPRAGAHCGQRFCVGERPGGRGNPRRQSNPER